MKMGMVAQSTFFKIQDTYCVDPIEKFWERNRADVLTRLRQKDRFVVLGKEMFYNLVIHDYIDMSVVCCESQEFYMLHSTLIFQCLFFPLFIRRWQNGFPRYVCFYVG